MASRSGTTSPRRARPLLRVALALAVGSGVLAGCGGGSTSGSTGSGPPASAGAHPSYQPTPADFRRIRALLARRATAVTQHDRAAYLATVDPTQPALLARERTLYANMSQLAVSRLSYGVDTSASLVPAPIPGTDPVLRPTVVEHLQLTGTFARPVSNPVAMTFVKRHGSWRVGAETEPTSQGHYDSPQERPWYGVPIAARRAGPMTVLVDRSQSANLAGLTTAVRDDIGYDARLLGVPASYRILVDATTNGLSYDFSSVNQQEAAAVTFGVAASDPLGTSYTAPAGLVIKVNPHTVDRVVNDAGIMRHELTHYLLHRYSGSSPTWLSEGVAAWVQYYPDDFARLQVPPDLYQRLMAADHTLPILGLFKEDPDVNYPIAQAAVAWLVSTYGMPKLLDLMRAYRSSYAGVNVDALTAGALRKVYGVTPAQVAAGAWRLLAQFQH